MRFIDYPGLLVHRGPQPKGLPHQLAALRELARRTGPVIIATQAPKPTRPPTELELELEEVRRILRESFDGPVNRVLSIAKAER